MKLRRISAAGGTEEEAMRFRTGLAALALLPAAAGVLAQERPPIRFDNWLYFQQNTNDTERWQYRPRLVPFNLPRG